MPNEIKPRLAEDPCPKCGKGFEYLSTFSTGNDAMRGCPSCGITWPIKKSEPKAIQERTGAEDLDPTERLRRMLS